jgi:hypothetical protein
MKHLLMIPSLVATSSILMLPVSAATVIGMNFTEIYSAPQISDGSADGFEGWTDSWLVAEGNYGNTTNDNDVSLNGTSHVKMRWNSSNIWNAGLEDNNEQGLYRQYLDDGDGATADGIGVSVTITGLSAWLLEEGMTAYQIRAYSSTDTDGATFHTIDIRDGVTLSGAILATISPAVLGAGDFPTGSGGTWQPRGYGDSSTALSADSITLTIPVNGGNVRGTLAALKITAIPEPSTTLLGGLGLLGMLVSRRSGSR